MKKQLLINILTLFFVTILPLFIVQCSEKDKNQTSNVIAKIGEETITTEDLDRSIEIIPEPYRYEYTSEQTLNDLVQSMIDWKLMAQEAIKLRLDEEADVKAQLETMKDKPTSQAEQLLVSKYIKVKQGQLEEVPETDVKNYYDNHQEEFTIPERVKIERVIYSSKENAQAASEAMTPGMSFKELMKQNPNFRRKVDSLWLRKSGKDSVMEKVAFNLFKGGISHVFETKAGYCLLRIEEKTPSTLRSYEEVKAGIKANLESQREKVSLEQLKKELRKNVSITINQPVLKAYLLKQQSSKTAPH